MGVAVHTMVQFIAVTDSMGITVIIFDLSTAVTCAKKLAVYINNILKWFLRRSLDLCRFVGNNKMNFTWGGPWPPAKMKWA